MKSNSVNIFNASQELIAESTKPARDRSKTFPRRTRSLLITIKIEVSQQFISALITIAKRKEKEKEEKPKENKPEKQFKDSNFLNFYVKFYLKHMLCFLKNDN